MVDFDFNLLNLRPLFIFAMSSCPADSAPSFADTLREQDELFYAVFPQARSNEYFHIGYSSSYVLSLANISSEPTCTPCPSITYPQARINCDPSTNVRHPLDVHTQCMQHTKNMSPTSGDLNRPIFESPWVPSFAHFPSIVTQQVPQLVPNIQNSFPACRPDGRRRRESHPLLTQQPQSDKLPIRLQQNKRTTDKKPALACLFCRARKIACGPPVPGTKEKTCGQCQRRSLTCVYPSESRRGMRKKKRSFAQDRGDQV